MNWENPKIPEGINVGREHPLKDFFSMLLMVGGFALLITLSLGLVAERLVVLVPLETERALAPIPDDEPLSEDQERTHAYLQSLAEQLAAAQGLPGEMPITVHYRDEEVLNAYATLGGHIFLYHGLIDKLSSENALSFVVAHEIAHVKHRDPMVAMGRGLAMAVFVASVMGVGDEVIARHVVGSIQELSELGFSRAQEAAADAAAMTTLQRHYGHINGADELFRVLQSASDDGEPPVIFSTHPLSESRLGELAWYATIHPATGALTPLPAWLGAGRQAAKGD